MNALSVAAAVGGAPTGADFSHDTWWIWAIKAVAIKAAAKTAANAQAGDVMQKSFLGTLPKLQNERPKGGKVSVSKIGAMTFVRAADINRDAFADMLRALVVDLDQNRIDLRYGRVKDG